ncbi:MAG TPA: phytanoyl-CoA dioxygenase family protein, partial [Acetobacteraceae bacterium]|nr:phytanoyl-CoA dioxygenase family protein [Acetobacteraceae bacterium]
EDYHALKHHPALINLLERMLGGPILPHPRVLMRNIFPARDEYTTKAHQDFPNVQGTTEVYTAWMPLIDCPMNVGPLQIAAGSHTGGVYDFGIAGGAGGIEIKDPLEGTWVSNDFAAGDVLLFHSMAVHKGVPNHSDRLRMSMDVRYQLVSEPFNIDNANADGQPLSWEDIYAGWNSDALKYYWQRLPLTLKPFDPIWFDKRDALGFELGEARDPRARSVLQRIVARDANPEKRTRAQRLLDALP